MKKIRVNIRDIQHTHIRDIDGQIARDGATVEVSEVLRSNITYLLVLYAKK